MTEFMSIEQGIENLLAQTPYGVEPQERHRHLLPLLKQELAYACEENPRFQNYLEHWPVDFRNAEKIADLPYLPAAAFKSHPPLALVNGQNVKRTLTSSATTGQVPSRVVLDTSTARRMSKGVVTIVRDFIGAARRPYLVIDTPENLASQSHMGARGAAIQAFSSFATEIVCCLQPGQDGDLSLDLQKLMSFSGKWRKAEVLVYGFTYVIWEQFVKPLQRSGIKLGMPNVHLLHSGGWKRLQQQAVTRDVFNSAVSEVFGCSKDRVIDFYGMVENVGVIYPDCPQGNKHVPAFAEVIIRDPLTLAPVQPGERGLIQICSVLPTSFPGFLLLTEDLAELIGDDGCLCGRRGTSFRFAGRVPRAEIRGCGNLENTRHNTGAQVSEVAWAT